MWISTLLCAYLISLTLACNCRSYEPPPRVADKTWIFAFGGRRSPKMDENGKLVGFDIDLVNKVCAVAKKKCDITLAEFTECTISDRNINYPGRGLMSGWFDACPGYVISPDRLGAFDFTKPYLMTDATFTVKQGNPDQFNPDSDDFSTFTIVHLTGAVTNAQCLNRLNKKFGNIIYASDLPDAKRLVLTGERTVLFSARHNIPDLEVLPQRFHCEIGGSAILLKKGSQLASWWNPAFDKIVESGEFKKLCDEANKKSKGRKRCLTKETMPALSGISKDNGDKRVWLFAASGRRKPANFLDDKGKLSGFNVDLVREVCREAGKVCESVLSVFTECSFTARDINYPGRGLSAGWFDACVGYTDSIDRANGVDFTDAFMRTYGAYAVLPNNPSGFNPDAQDFSNFTITHLTGAPTNAQCLHRLHKKGANIVISQNLPAAKKLIFDKKVDVIFSVRSKIPDLEVLPQRVHCEQTGSCVMTKKGSSLVEWWNEAFRSFVKKGLYHELCQESTKKYNYTVPIKCFPEGSPLPTKGPLEAVLLY